MKLFSTKELRARFATVEAQKMAAFKKEHPRPSPPQAKQIETELRKGQVRINGELLGKAMLPSRNRISGEDDELDVNFFEVVCTPSLRVWRRDLLAWESDLKSYKSALAAARDLFLDRIILDHENAFLLLQDFKNWRTEDEDDWRKREPRP